MDPQRRVERTEQRGALRRAIGRPPERDPTVVELYHLEGVTLAQIGEVLGVTELRVSQLHTKAVVTLRAELAVAPG